MNNFFDLLKTRRSIRKYLPKAVEPEKIKQITTAALMSPASKRSNPWEFIVVQDRKNLLKITEIHPYSHMLKEAPLAIVVCADSTRVPCAVPDMLLWPQDCSAATENIMLQAAEMDLGTVWMGVYPKEEMMSKLQELFELPENIKPFSIIAVGHPAGEVRPKDKFNPARIHHEKW